MFPFRKYGSRRAEIRKNLPMPPSHWKRRLMARDSLVSIAITVIFGFAAFGILTLRDDVVRYRPGQYVAQDIYSRTEFSYLDSDDLQKAQDIARQRTARIYAATDMPLLDLQKELAKTPATQPLAYETSLQNYMTAFRALPILLPADRQEDTGRMAVIPVRGEVPLNQTYTTETTEELRPVLARLAAEAGFGPDVQPAIVALSLKKLEPTLAVDVEKTEQARKRAADRVPQQEFQRVFHKNDLLIRHGNLDQDKWRLLQEEQRQFGNHLRTNEWIKSRAGMAVIVALITLAMAAYITSYQPRIIRNHSRAVALAVLLLSMLVLAQLAGVGSGPLYIWGIGPTILVAMILATVYDRRFSMGIASMQALLVTIALDQAIGFFLILLVGARVCCLLLDDVRNRGKLIEVGGLTALAMVLATAAVGGINLEPMRVIRSNCLYVGSAGLAAGFVVLGILPFIEKLFRITTSVTLLEWADASQPLLRRLALEAPGTYNHSLQVAILAEEAAEVVAANSLLCRVGAYYHDIGKINKADYFCENQARGENRHINLSPSVSLLIIVGHVKDGLEMAREYNLPTALFPFIQQHHGTTLVEYFYHQAVTQHSPNELDGQTIEDSQYRYPGPRPRTKEAAIVMLADAVEGATRAMVEPTPARTETLVHELTMKRLHDGQFDECPLTFRELSMIERSMVKTILGIYHARMAYPSTRATTHGTGEAVESKTA